MSFEQRTLGKWYIEGGRWQVCLVEILKNLDAHLNGLGSSILCFVA